MRIKDTPLDGLKVIEPTVYEDERGFFFESYNADKFATEIGCAVRFVQDNHSRSALGVLRGLHFQARPHEQGKLVRVIAGQAFDVAVDMRPNSPTYGQWHAETLSAENKLQIWIPPGFAHGFLAQSERTDFLYKTTEFWHPECERTILWNDPDLAIDWPLASVPRPILSEKDQQGYRFASFEPART